MLEQYQRKRCLKENDLAQIWECLDEINGSSVVVKEYKDFFPEEVYKILIDLQHPNIAQVKQAEPLENGYCVIETFVEGVSIQDQLDGGRRYTQREVIDLGIQICDILDMLHRRNVVYRDLKPAHLIQREDGTVCLIDFNAARVFKTGADKDTRYLGTVGYAPPEQYGFQQSDLRVDIYALGVTLYEMLTGMLPNENVCFNGKLKQIMRKCLEFDPDKRFQTISEVKSALYKAKYVVRSSILQVGLLISCLMILWSSYPLWNVKNESQAEFPLLQEVDISHETFGQFLNEPAISNAIKEATGEFADYYTDYRQFGDILSSVYDGRAKLLYVETILAVYEFWQDGTVRIEHCRYYDYPNYELLVYTNNENKNRSGRTIEWEESLVEQRSIHKDLEQRMIEFMNG